VKALKITADTKPPAGCRYELTPDGGAILHAEPSLMILYQTAAALPALTPKDQANSTLHWYREPNRLGITSAVDAGGGGHQFPTDYTSSAELAKQPRFPIRLGLYLFAQKPGSELDSHQQWTNTQRLQMNVATGRLNGYLTAGAVQNRLYFAGEYFVERYGAEAARQSPPLRKLIRAGVPVGAGTDGTRVSSHNPWKSLYWLVTGKTAGGL